MLWRMISQPRAPRGFLARERELERIRAVVSAAREGQGGAPVVDGEPGIGKTALLDRVRGAADGECLLRVTGLEFEATFS